jgi:predicted Fe-Mo cluster-binding NifX family protein
MTRLCIPTEGAGGLDGRVGEHFGRVPTFTLVDSDTGEVEVLDNTSEHMGGSGLPADLLVQAGVEVVLCQGLGRRAIQLLSAAGVSVCTGASGTVAEAVAAWKGGTASEAGESDACERHAFHDRHA